jgi:membrane protein DedA with SNARE-associated domain
MNRFSISAMFLCWIGILFIELISFYNFIHQVHDQSEMYFYLMLIFITLVVGAVGLIVTSLTNRKK